MIVVFAPCHDDATRCSHWVAYRSCERLTAALGPVTTLLEGDQAGRAALEQALTRGSTGLAFFGHGGPDRLFDASGDAAVDEQNIHRLRGQWVHAFACRAGGHLAGPAISAGVACFVGYESALYVGWSPDHIPAPVRAAFVQLVTQTTLELASGVTDGDILRRAALEAQAEVIVWCDANSDEAGGLEILAQQLLARLVVRTAATG